MKKPLKNETDMLESINKIQALLIVLDKKVDTLVRRLVSEAKPALNVPARSNDHNHGRTMHKAICADCKKECSLPFKPSGDRPVYCQDCFSRRKVISLSGIKVDDKSKEAPAVQPPSNKAIDIQKPQVKRKKKAVTVKEPIGKKKLAPKKK